MLKPLHVGISVENLSDSLQWYKNVLGFSLVDLNYYEFLQANIAIISNGWFEIELFQYDTPQPLPNDRRHPNEDLKTIGTKHLCLCTDNMERTLVHLKEHNVDIVFHNSGIKSEHPMCFLRDNSGVLIEIIQRKDMFSREGEEV